MNKILFTLIAMLLLISPANAGWCSWGYRQTADAIDAHEIVVEAIVTQGGNRWVLPEDAQFWELHKIKRPESLTLQVLENIKGAPSASFVVDYDYSIWQGGIHLITDFPTGFRGVFFLHAYEDTPSLSACAPVFSRAELEAWKFAEENDPQWMDCDRTGDGQCDFFDAFVLPEDE